MSQFLLKTQRGYQELIRTEKDALSIWYTPDKVYENEVVL